ncbi:MAG: 2-amino-4-hydroxy-6-hydroxymethyldihydropteridine diphosphokinase, partial [Planctomycetota bacterium]
ETEPVGGPAGQGAYLNTVIRVRWAHGPRTLLALAARTEDMLGRRREQRWGPRTIDIDLLLYDDCVLDDEGLTLPHPRLDRRAFVLEPLAELAAELTHPVLGETIAALKARAVKRPDAPFVRLVRRGGNWLPEPQGCPPGPERA